MKNLKNNVLVKVLTIGVLILLLLVPSVLVQELIHEREYTQLQAISEVSSKWGKEQTITGPFLSVPYDRYQEITNQKDSTVTLRRYTEWLHVLPHELKIEGQIAPEKRYRGLYEVVVYGADLNLTGDFSSLDFDKYDIDDKDIRYEDATINIGVTDLKGIENQISLNWNGAASLFNPGTSTKEVVTTGINAPVLVTTNDSTRYAFDLNLDLKGSQKLYFAPLGKTTDVTLKSDWTTPSFTGSFIPDSREITESGFTANWNVLHLNRNFPQVWKSSQYQVRGSEFGTTLLLPVDNYQKSYRVAKYAILFIVLTYLVFFFVEILNGVLIHPIQYLLVGIALIVFYSLLLAFSEHIRYNLAYIISAILTISLITLYTMKVLKSKKLGGFIAGLLTILYGFIFTIIQLEQYALLIGSIGVFVILAVVMYASQKVDWYEISIGKQESKNSGHTAKVISEKKGFSESSGLGKTDD